MTKIEQSDEERTRQRLGSAMRAARLQHFEGTLSAFATKIGRAPGNLSEYENGRKHVPRKVVQKYERELELDPRSLMVLWEEADAAREAARRNDGTPSGSDRSWSKRLGQLWKPLAALIAVTASVAVVWVFRDAGGESRDKGGRTTPSVANTPTILTPVAETWVNEGAPTRNFGFGVPDFTSELFSRGQPGLVTYMRFDLPPPPSGKRLTAAVLMIRTTIGEEAGSADAHDVRMTSNAWSQSELTWKSQPDSSGETVGVISAPTPDTAYSVPLNVSVLARAVGPTTLTVRSSNPVGRDQLIFWGSRFERADYRVKLALTYD